MNKNKRSQTTIFIVSCFILFIPVLAGCTGTVTGADNASSDSTQESAQAEIEQSEETVDLDKSFFSVDVGNKMNVLIHKKTDVQYLKIIRNSGMDGGIAITTLLKPDGTPHTGETNTIKADRFHTEELDSHHKIVTDKETGIYYLVVIRNAGMDGGIDITPLLNGDGAPYTNLSKEN